LWDTRNLKLNFPGLFNSFPIHSGALVTAVFRQVIVSNSLIDIVSKTNYLKISN
jgi:hypothetical protein